jgi:hypothetical protein
VILGFPNETRQDMLATIRYTARMPIAGIKLHMLFILRNTRLEQYYRQTHFPVMSQDEYCELIADCLELLPPDMVIHRLTGDGPKKLLVEPLWTSNKLMVFNQIQRVLKQRETWQGRLYPSD